jgi:hypothetical protein
VARTELTLLSLVLFGTAALCGAQAGAQEAAPADTAQPAPEDGAAVTPPQAEDAATDVPAGGATTDAPINAAPAMKITVCSTAKNYKECKLLCGLQFPPKIKPKKTDEAQELARLAVHGWWSLGAGVALLVGGSVAGGVALHLNKELSKECTGGSCPPERHADLDTRDRLGVTSTVLIAGGVAASAVGILILAVFSRPPKAEGEKPAAAFVPSLGPDAVGATLAWRF